MKLKGIRTIALLLVGLVLVVGSIAGTAAVRAGEVPRTDVYWWEDCRWKKSTEDLGPYYLNQAKELWLFIFDHYFGMDISRLTFYELEALGNETGHELLAEKVARHWKGPVVEKAIVELEPLLPQPDVYWWYIVGDPEAKVEWIMEQVAETKGMSADAVSERFGELFPGVDLWSMTFDEFDQFLRDMPQPPLVALRPVCFDELRERPLIMGLFGTVPELSTEEELEEFNHKLEKVLDAALPILRQLPRCEFAFEGLVVSRGAISIAVGCLDFPMEEVYEIIADKAEMFGIEDIPVTFSDGRGSGLDALPPYAGPLGSSSSGWEAPWNEPFGGCPDSRIPGAVKVTCPAGGSSTASFSVRQFTWNPLDIWDEDLIITGHKGPGITPINMRIYQPLPPYLAGTVADNVATITYADAARVAVCDAKLQPYILIGGSPSNPVFRPIFDADDPPEPKDGKEKPRIWISAARTGVTFQVSVYSRHTFPNWGPWEQLRNQVMVRPVGDTWSTQGDSGSPYWTPLRCPTRGPGAKIHGLHVGRRPVHGTLYMVLSPLSGLSREFPGWAVWRK